MGSFWQAKTKIRSVDTLYSSYRRAKAKWKCEKCGRDCSDDKQYLTTSHFHGRRKESVRFDDENTSALCRKCHHYLEEHKNDYEKWLIDIIGQKRFDLLTLAANTPCKKDDVATRMIIKKLLADQV